MTARDELAELIGNLLYVDSFYGDMFYGGQNRKTLAELLLAAGYRKPRTITTAEELDALPNDAVVMSETIAYQKYGHDSWAGDGRFFGTAQVALPATVLHEGAQS